MGNWIIKLVLEHWKRINTVYHITLSRFMWLPSLPLLTHHPTHIANTVSPLAGCHWSPFNLLSTSHISFVLICLQVGYWQWTSTIIWSLLPFFSLECRGAVGCYRRHWFKTFDKSICSTGLVVFEDPNSSVLHFLPTWLQGEHIFLTMFQ